MTNNEENVESMKDNLLNPSKENEFKSLIFIPDKIEK